MIIGLDLDNTVFNAEPIFKMGFKYFHNYRYHLPQDHNLYNCYPKEVADKIMEYFKTKPGYNTKPFNPKYSIPNVRIKTVREKKDNMRVIIRFSTL